VEAFSTAAGSTLAEANAIVQMCCSIGVARLQHALFYCCFEAVVVRDHAPVWIVRCLKKYFRNRLARQPGFCWTIIDGEADAQHIGGGISGVAPSANKVETRR
jgi:hypothetical protein